MAPLVLALVGINFRGAAFALSHFGRETGRELPLGVLVFERVLTPFTPGLAVAATAAGRITIAGGEPLTGTGAWAKPFTLVAFLTVLPIGATVIIPSLFYPYWTFRGEPAPEIPPAGSETD